MKHFNVYFSRSCLIQMRRKVLKRGKIASGSFQLRFCPLPNEKLNRTDSIFKAWGMWKYLHPQYQDISHEVQICSVTLSANTLQNAACFQGRGKCILTQLLVTGDQDRKQCFGDSLNLCKILYFCLRNIQSLGPCTSGYREWICSKVQHTGTTHALRAGTCWTGDPKPGQ